MALSPQEQARLDELRAKYQSPAAPAAPQKQSLADAAKESEEYLREPSLAETASSAGLGLLESATMGNAGNMRGLLQNALEKPFQPSLRGGIANMLGAPMGLPGMALANRLINSEETAPGREAHEEMIKKASSDKRAGPFGYGQLAGDVANAGMALAAPMSSGARAVEDLASGAKMGDVLSTGIERPLGRLMNMARRSTPESQAKALENVPVAGKLAAAGRRALANEGPRPPNDYEAMIREQLAEGPMSTMGPTPVAPPRPTTSLPLEMDDLSQQLMGEISHGKPMPAEMATPPLSAQPIMSRMQEAMGPPPEARSAGQTLATDEWRGAGSPESNAPRGRLKAAAPFQDVPPAAAPSIEENMLNQAADLFRKAPSMVERSQAAQMLQANGWTPKAVNEAIKRAGFGLSSLPATGT